MKKFFSNTIILSLGLSLLAPFAFGAKLTNQQKKDAQKHLVTAFKERNIAIKKLALIQTKSKNLGFEKTKKDLIANVKKNLVAMQKSINEAATINKKDKDLINQMCKDAEGLEGNLEKYVEHFKKICEKVYSLKPAWKRFFNVVLYPVKKHPVLCAIGAGVAGTTAVCLIKGVNPLTIFKAHKQVEIKHSPFNQEDTFGQMQSKMHNAIDFYTGLCDPNETLDKCQSDIAEMTENLGKFTETCETYGYKDLISCQEGLNGMIKDVENYKAMCTGYETSEACKLGYETKLNRYQDALDKYKNLCLDGEHFDTCSERLGGLQDQLDQYKGLCLIDEDGNPEDFDTCSARLGGLQDQLDGYKDLCENYNWNTLGDCKNGIQDLSDDVESYKNLCKVYGYEAYDECVDGIAEMSKYKKICLPNEKLENCKKRLGGYKDNAKFWNKLSSLKLEGENDIDFIDRIKSKMKAPRVIPCNYSCVDENNFYVIDKENTTFIQDPSIEQTILLQGTN